MKPRRPGQTGNVRGRIRIAAAGDLHAAAGDSERIRGRRTKLCRGGGQDVAHSMERPHPHGSSTVTLGACLAVLYTFQRNGNVDAPRMKAPIVEIVFDVVNPSEAR